MIRLIAGFLARESAQRPENAGFLLGSGIAGDGNQQLSGSLIKVASWRRRSALLLDARDERYSFRHDRLRT
jgi:hypothetical protein